MENLVTGDDGLRRCGWCGNDPLYKAYHDREWGHPALDDCSQFEFLVLESAQAGLSWITILRKREAYRKAYGNFSPGNVAEWDNKKIDELVNNAGIVRNRRKIEASMFNARALLELSSKYGSFATWLLGFYNGTPKKNVWNSLDEIPAKTRVSELIAGEMKSLGFRFLGPVILYSHLQATGIVNDHLTGCWKRR